MPKPDLGENVRVFSPEDGLENIHRVTEDVFKRQHKRQFARPLSARREAL